ncbi:acetyltransferase GCN5 [Devosia pacifica]|uniref:Acetyltransferase GCN5 n=1 Tax=Devosia pacifica TaxID=1335967 RepID=A0A918VU15_9HYPH|nr:GNAT family protein [Devosia pacifica]GHA22907.1 acetyltransferase GCN5 [Devosia pacifica]
MNPHPAKGPPEKVILNGRYTRLEPIGPQHVNDLYAVFSGDAVRERFRYLFSYPPASREDMAAWIDTAAATEDPLYFAVVDLESGRAGGHQSLMRIEPKDGVIEMGGVHWAPPIAGTRVATEALYLFARYVFDDLGYRRFEWKCNALNAPSRRAAERFGFTFEGIFRQHMIQKGENRDTAWFSMLDGEWPTIRAAFERWLDPANFDAEGQQRDRLTVR